MCGQSVCNIVTFAYTCAMQTHVVGQVKCVMGDSSDVELPSDDGGLPPACLMGLRVSFLDFRESFISEVSYLFFCFFVCLQF